jgi:hypothetical protein
VPDYNNLTQCEALDDIKLNLVRQQQQPPVCAPSRRAGHSSRGFVCEGGGAANAAAALLASNLLAAGGEHGCAAIPRAIKQGSRRDPPPRSRARPTQLFTCANLTQPQTATDYGAYLANEASPLFTSTIVDRCTRKLVDDWNMMRCQADEKLAKFLDFCTYGHMIDNVVLIVTGTLHERDVQVHKA